MSAPTENRKNCTHGLQIDDCEVCRETSELAPVSGSVNLRFRIRLCCDYGHGEKWGEWHELAMPRAQYGKLLDKILADPEIKDFEIQYSPGESPNKLTDEDLVALKESKPELMAKIRAILSPNDRTEPRRERDKL